MEFVVGIKNWFLTRKREKDENGFMNFQKGNSSRPTDSFRYPFVSCCLLSNASEK
jgi:hypothetical protein